jgi:hypothetical protein
VNWGAVLEKHRAAIEKHVFAQPGRDAFFALLEASGK